MYLMYVDESGDSGLVGSPKRYFVLTGLIIHETRWQSSLDRLIAFRRRMNQGFGLKLREEIHAYELINKPKSLSRIKKSDRLTIIRAFSDEIASMPDINIVNIVVDKSAKQQNYDVFESAWKALIQRFENTLLRNNFPGPAHPNEHGLILPDRTDDKKLTKLLRKMRRYNPVPSIGGHDRKNLILSRVAEDPSFKDSAHSFFTQATDLSAYLLQQNLAPCAYMRKKGGHNYFYRLKPALCTVASRGDPYGIVRL